MKPRTCHCGRKITVTYQGKVYIPEDNHHDLCQKCWKAEKDRERIKTA